MKQPTQQQQNSGNNGSHFNNTTNVPEETGTTAVRNNSLDEQMAAKISVTSTIGSNSNSNSSNSSGRRPITDDLKRSIQELSKKIDEKQASASSSKFVKVADGQKKAIRIVPRMPEEITMYYESAPTIPITRYKFWVYEQNPDNDGVLHDISDEPKEFTTSVTLCKELLRWMEKGIFLVEVSRKGNDLKTKYTVDPIL